MAEENMYANVNEVIITGPNKGLQPLRAPHRRSKVTVERVALVVLSVLLLAAVAALVGLNARDRVKANPSPRCSCEDKPRVMETTEPVPTCAMKLHCGPHWELNGRKCYFFSANKLIWNDSSVACLNMSGELVKVDSREEQRFLADKMKDLMTEDEDKFWIGLTDSQTEGVWMWMDGIPLDPSLAFWFNDGHNIQPDNYEHNHEGEDCGRMGKTAQFGFEENCWFDHYCNNPNKYICEKEPTQSSDCH